MFGVLKNYCLDEKRKSRNWRAAASFEKKARLEEAFFRWSLFVEKQKKMALAARIINDKQEKALKSRYFGALLQETRKLLQLSQTGLRIKAQVDLALAAACVRQMVELSSLHKEAKVKQRKADLYRLASLFQQFRASTKDLMYERQREEIGNEAADTFHQESVFKKCFRGLREAFSRAGSLEQEAGLYAEVQLLRKAFESFRKRLAGKNADVPIYSNRQVFLGYKYLGLLSGREGLRMAPQQAGGRNRREAGVSRIERDSQSASQTLHDFLPLMSRQPPERAPEQGPDGDWDSESESDREAEVDSGKQRGLMQLRVSETSRPELEDLVGPLQQTSARRTKASQVYELPCITDRFNPRKIEQSNRRLNQLVLERLFSHWSNKVISKRSFKHSLALSLLKKTFVSLRQHTNERAAEKYADQKADKQFRARWLARGFESFVINAKKLAPLYRRQKHFELERNISLVTKCYVSLRSQFLDCKRLQNLLRDAEKYHLMKSKTRSLRLLKDWSDRSKQLRLKEESVALNAKKRTFRAIVGEWLRLIPEEGKTTRKELAAGKRAAKKKLAIVFQAWLRVFSELQMHKQLVERFHQQTRTRLKQAAFAALVTQLSSLAKGKKFQVFLDSMHQRKLQAKALCSLQANVGYEQDKRAFESRFAPAIHAATLRSVGGSDPEPEEVVSRHFLQSENKDLRLGDRAGLQEGESAQNQRPQIALQEHHTDGQGKQAADPPPRLLCGLEETRREEAVPRRRTRPI